MKASRRRLALFAIDAFAGLTAIGGGIALAIGLEGSRFPLTWLEGTPFGSYLGPGVILAVVVGGSAAVAAVATWRDARLGGWASMLAGAVMVGWILGEVFVLRGDGEPVSATELIYLVVGLAMAGLGWLVARRAATEARQT